MNARRKLGIALMAGALALGVTAAPASANHSCPHTVSQFLTEVFGSKKAAVEAYNEATGRNFTVGQLNQRIRLYCEGVGS